jgi:hypothetical protein
MVNYGDVVRVTGDLKGTKISNPAVAIQQQAPILTDDATQRCLDLLQDAD